MEAKSEEFFGIWRNYLLDMPPRPAASDTAFLDPQMCRLCGTSELCVVAFYVYFLYISIHSDFMLLVVYSKAI